MRLAPLAALFSLLLPAAHAVAPGLLGVLARGINLDSAVFEQPQSLDQWSDDLAAIERAGFRHVRIFVNLDWTENAQMDREPNTARLDGIVRAAGAHHLGVILCAYSKRRPMDDTADSETVREWLEGWRRLAQRYRAVRPERMFFEVANEPGMQGARWAGIQEKLRAAIRAEAPSHAILLTPSPLSGTWALDSLPISADPNVAYVVHLYQPMVFSHQGAGWANPIYQPVTGLDYPPNEGNVLAILSRSLVASNPGAIQALEQYSWRGGVMMHDEIATAAKWSREHHVPVVVTEFGTHDVAPAASRAAWLRDARQEMEAAGFGWTVFHYVGGFGIKAELQGSCGPVKQALGLC